jgi:hypothetical protein
MKTAAFAVCVLISALVIAEEPDFKPLFDGKSLSGWEGNQSVFHVKDGAIVAGSRTEKIAHNEFLASQEEFGDFELRLQARLVGKGQNAGVQFRSQRIPNHFEMIGYQCDMGTMNGRPIWGWLYDESRRRKFLAEADDAKLAAVLKSEDWNDLVIRCEGPHIQIWVNGLATIDYTEADAEIPRRGRLAVQIHGGEPAEASYRSLRIKTLGNSK